MPQSFSGEKKKYVSPRFEKMPIEEVEMENLPVYKTSSGVRELSKHDIRKVKKVIEAASKYEKDENGLPKMKSNYYMKFYDFPISFALHMKDKQMKGEDTHIIEEVPEMFKGLDMDKVCKTLDIADIFLHDYPRESKFNIDGRDFEFEWYDAGSYGDVYKLKSEGYPTLAFKVFYYPKNVGIHGPFGEIALEREASKAGVIDVPKFYMASPLGSDIRKDGDIRPYSYASWMLSEFITQDTPLKTGDLTFKKFLKKKNLMYKDNHMKNHIGNYYLDFGGAVRFLNSYFYCVYGYGEACPISRMVIDPKFYNKFFGEDNKE